MDLRSPLPFSFAPTTSPLCFALFPLKVTAQQPAPLVIGGSGLNGWACACECFSSQQAQAIRRLPVGSRRDVQSGCVDEQQMQCLPQRTKNLLFLHFSAYVLKPGGEKGFQFNNR
ncbi:hypothetical protein UPYG_G00172450 [Umbra pygmaea]|uniref:Secreted protein n=1 Tax=Umbra pygmaea TaxID=75934 RepID=A0ABD0WPA1_UMBPY